MRLRQYTGVLVLLAVLVLPTHLRGDSDDPEAVIAKARALSAAKHRDQALRLLEDYLAENDDGDVRLVYGLMLSWDGQYEQARRELKAVLLEHPKYTDAARGLANVELWSDHPEAAEEITARFLEIEPDDWGLMIQRARALRALKMRHQALQVIARILELNPGDKEAHDLREAIEYDQQAWSTVFTQSNTWFSGGFSPWSEQSISMKRGADAGSTIFRFSRAEQFGYTSNLLEVDAYPHLWKGAYAYVNAGFSPDHNLYPTYRFGSDIYQNLGRGWEASGGFRRLIFSTTEITVLTGLIGRYHANWYYSVRTFITPDQAGPSRTIQLQARRYYGRDRFFSLGYSTGASPFEVRSLNELGILNSQSVTAGLNWYVAKWFVTASGGWAMEDRINLERQAQYNLSLSIARRF